MSSSLIFFGSPRGQEKARHLAAAIRLWSAAQYDDLFAYLIAVNFSFTGVIFTVTLALRQHVTATAVAMAAVLCLILPGLRQAESGDRLSS